MPAQLREVQSAKQKSASPWGGFFPAREAKIRPSNKAIDLAGIREAGQQVGAEVQVFVNTKLAVQRRVRERRQEGPEWR